MSEQTGTRRLDARNIFNTTRRAKAATTRIKLRKDVGLLILLGTAFHKSVMNFISPWRWNWLGALAMVGSSGWLVRSTDAFPMRQPVGSSMSGAVSSSRSTFGLYGQSAASSSGSGSRTDSTPSSTASSSSIDYQRDHGRGIHHLTADLAEGDVVVYQTGTWYVDGVAVGNGQEEAWEYCLVDNLQIVWSHNCEHGVVRGFALVPEQDGRRRLEADWNEMVDFGPEQLVARLSVTAVEGEEEEEEGSFQAFCELSDDLWRVEER
jgi:hypothetical protein